MYDPKTANDGGGSLPSKGKKLLHGVGRSRWTTDGGTTIEDVEFVILRSMSDDPGADVGMRCTGRFFLTDKAMWRFGKFCLAVGQHEPFKHELASEMERVISLGAVFGVISHEEYDGKTRARVDAYTAFNGEVDPGWDELIAKGESAYQEFRAKMEEEHGPRGGGGSSSQGSLSGSDEGGGGRSQSQGPDDDIPF